MDSVYLPLIATIMVGAFFLGFLFGKSFTKNRENPPIPKPILTSSSLSASAATDLLGQYEVFLSFCGKDTRYGFTDFLYTSLHGAGIRTFRDDNELRIGEEIGLELKKAIKEFKIWIPIFSKNYAYSKWCLLELAHIVECVTNEEQMIFPIFYDVDPYEVRHQSGSYEEAIHQHRRKKCFDEKIVQKWEEALTKVGQLKGLELKKETGRREGQLVKIIVEKVSNFLKKNYKHESKNLVGMENHIKEMKGLLQVNINGVRVIGVHGMGGLGKTTIAKAIYNQLCGLFECHCFLEDVRENTKKRHNGIIHLQDQLLSKILKKKNSKIGDVDEGMNRIKDAVHGKKVFIVLDDVDEKFQIDKLVGSYRWFSAQSRIIITTRNGGVLRLLKETIESEGQLEVYTSYKPTLMDNDHSLQLFSKHAFTSDSPPKGYGVLSRKVVSTAAGLPLVLVTIGSSLFGETDKKLWEEKYRKLKNIPDKEVLEKLRVSFDPLNDEEKKIFLDIACLFVGKDKTNPCYMWDDCNFSPRNGLDVLVQRSLITVVGDDNILGMHDQLRDLGRQIVCEENSNLSGRWSRLWHNDKALDIIMARQGTENIEALCLDFIEPDQARLVGEDFRKLPNLRYLTLNYAELDGDFEHCLPNLRWLQWWGCLFDFTPTNLYLKNLVILDLSYSNVTDDLDFWSQLKKSTRLKVLILFDSPYLSKVPYLSTFSNLEKLEVGSCPSLYRLDGIKELESLIFLRIRSCEYLERLPNLFKLRKLKELYVFCCYNLIEIPGLDKLVSIEILNMRFCSLLERVPNLSNLKKLKTLDASECRKLIEIQGLDMLGSLELLYVGGCTSLEGLPNLSNLKMLRVLKTESCLKLIEIQGLEGLESLEHLDMSGCVYIERLPDLSSLRMLKDLRLCNCNKLRDVEGVLVVVESSLESLDISSCDALGPILDLRNLKKLRKLDMSFLLEVNEIWGLEELKSLESLYIYGCNSIKKLPDFSNLKKLKEINATDCEKLIEIRGLEKLEFLSDLYIHGCKSLKNLPHLPNTMIHMDHEDNAESTVHHLSDEFPGWMWSEHAPL